MALSRRRSSSEVGLVIGLPPTSGALARGEVQKRLDFWCLVLETLCRVWASFLALEWSWSGPGVVRYCSWSSLGVVLAWLENSWKACVLFEGIDWCSVGFHGLAPVLGLHRHGSSSGYFGI